MDKTRKGEHDLLKLYDSCIQNELRCHNLFIIMMFGRVRLVSLPLRRDFLTYPKFPSQTNQNHHNPYNSQAHITSADFS